MVELAYNFKLYPKRKTFLSTRHFSASSLFQTFCLLYNFKILVNSDITDLGADLMLVQLQLEVFRSVLVGLLSVVLLFLCVRRKQKKLSSCR